MRLFVAVRPPDDVLDAVAALARPAHPGVRWTTRDQWHVTLRFLGEVGESEPVAAALAAAPLPAATAALGPRVTALGSGVVCLPVAGLDALAAAVSEATAGWGRPPEHRRFRGHLTLARVDRPRRATRRGDPFRAGRGGGGGERGSGRGEGGGGDQSGAGGSASGGPRGSGAADRSDPSRAGGGGGGERGRGGAGDDRPRARSLAGEALAARFPVADVRLVRSHLGRPGARYEDLLVRPLPNA